MTAAQALLTLGGLPVGIWIIVSAPLAALALVAAAESGVIDRIVDAWNRRRTTRRRTDRRNAR